MKGFDVIRNDLHFGMRYKVLLKNEHSHNVIKAKNMKQVGIVGWRGMVGSVLLQRMVEENDFDNISAHFYSTSSAGAAGPLIGGVNHTLNDRQHPLVSAWNVLAQQICAACRVR